MTFDLIEFLHHQQAINNNDDKFNLKSIVNNEEKEHNCQPMPKTKNNH